MSEVFERYCNDVCSQVRCKFFRTSIAAELTAHLEDHADGLIASGTDPDAAASEAVVAMGDPVSVGRELDRLHSPLLFWLERCTRWALWGVLFLLAWGLCWHLAASGYGVNSGSPYSEEELAAHAQQDILEQMAELSGGVLLDPDTAFSSWFSGEGTTLDHARLFFGDCYLIPSPDGTYTFAARLYNVSKNPFLDSSLVGDYDKIFSFTDFSQKEYPIHCFYDAIACTGLTPDIKYLTVTYDFLGKSCRWQVPLNWGDLRATLP
ncbi:MAG: permease prefix domain 1-containing protein [Oscillospiraceae bacterium]